MMGAVLGMLLAAGPSAAQATISFTGQPGKQPPVSGTIDWDGNNVYVTARVEDAATAVDEDYLAVSLDVDNNDRWTAGATPDGMLVYDAFNNDGASWRPVAELNYDQTSSDVWTYAWDCPWSDPKVRPGDAAWPTGMSISMTPDGGDLLYEAVIPLAGVGINPGDTIGVLIQTRDKNVSLYGGNGRVINYWPDSDAFNKLYDPAQYEDVTLDAAPAALIPEPLTLLGVLAGAAGLARYLRRRRGV